MKKRSATLEDVAKIAGVSTATVSRCLNNPSRVKAATLLKVESTIQKIGYAPNFGAQALASNQTKIIGAIIPTMENAIFATGIQAFQEALSEAGYTLLVASSAYQRNIEEKQIRNLISRGVDALLLIGEDRDPKIYDFLKKRGVPYVLAWNYRSTHDQIFVGFDNVLAASNAAEKVIELGHDQIAIIVGETAQNDRARDRKTGYLSAFLRHGIQCSHLVECPYNFEAARVAFAEIMHNAPQTTAILCGNDVLAVGALLQAQDMNIKVPEQIALMGFDDIEISRLVSPKLSTVHVPHRQMGRHSALKIIEILQQDLHQKSIELKSYVVMREST